jgi:hypothetical protein
VVRLGVDEQAPHRAEVEDDAAVVGAEAGETVGTTADGQGESGFAAG